MRNEPEQQFVLELEVKAEGKEVGDIDFVSGKLREQITSYFD